MTGKEKIVEYLQKNGPATDDEMAVGIDMIPSSVRTRRLELELERIVEPVGRVQTRSGKLTWLWKLRDV